MTHHQQVSQSAAKRRATRADLEALPENVLGEIIEGVLYTFPRPRAKHSNVIGELCALLRGPYQNERGGWWILPEPGIELPDAAEIVPDVGGWRRERLHALPDDPISIAPDWVCEVLSPSTRHHDQVRKRRFYARHGVSHLWFVDPEARTLVVSRLENGRWVELGSWGEDECVRAEPFELVDLELATWWAPAE